MDVEVERRTQGQRYVRYVDPNHALNGQTEPAVLHTTHWTGEQLYFDPNPHPTADGPNSCKNQRKLRGVAEGCIVVMQIDTDAALRASGRYEGEFRVIKAKIAPSGAHALILERTGRNIVIASR